MSVTLDLEPSLDEQLRALAEAEGISVEQYLGRLIRGAVGTRSGAAGVALLRSWEEEDSTQDPEEIARRQRDWDAFREAMNRSHSSNRILFP
jgi:hypothetical protein